MGIAAVGNIGAVIANLFAPLLASIYGWHAVLGFATIPLAVTLLAFLLMAKDSPTKPKSVPTSRYVAALGKADLWWLCLLYSVTFGGFVGLSTFLPQFFHNQYQLDAIENLILIMQKRNKGKRFGKGKQLLQLRIRCMIFFQKIYQYYL